MCTLCSASRAGVLAKFERILTSEARASQTAMPRPTYQQRSDPHAAARMVDSIFEELPREAQRSYCRFLAASIAYLSRHHPDRWGVTLREYGVRLNAGWVESLVLWQGGQLRVLVEKDSAPPRANFDGHAYPRAPGCETVALPLSDLPRLLPKLTKPHHAALRIAAGARPCPRSIREAHSPGVTEWLSQILHRAVPNPEYWHRHLHIVQGGIENGDKARLQRGTADWWMVPKTAAVGDEVVICILGIGLFATARVTSGPRSRKDWPKRYRANMDSFKLIQPPISLVVLRREIPDFSWLKYPRGITTPPSDVADHIRALIRRRQEGDVESANMDELRATALDVASLNVTPKKGTRIYRTGSAAIRRYVLQRAQGRCEACKSPAPFRDACGQPFLETHHTTRLADEGPDHPATVIGICPNCHKKAHLAEDRVSFNRSLIRRLRILEAAP
jgi:hypothetical protein